MCDSSTYACNEVEKTLEQNRTYVYFDKNIHTQFMVITAKIAWKDTL